MILVTPHQSIVAVLASSPATQPDFASFVDVYSGSSRIGSRAAQGSLNGTTVVQIVENPSGSETRRVVSLTISNRHSAAIVCTVKVKDGDLSRTLVETSIGVDETLQWDGSRWSIFPEPVSSIGAVDIVVSGDVTLGDDLSVGDDASIGGDLAVTGTSTFTGALTFTGWTLIAAKGDLPVGTANDTVGILTAASNYHVLQTNSTEATGLQWSHRRMIWHAEIADSATYASSSSESSAMYTATAIPSALINEQRKMIHCFAGGKFSATGTPTWTVRFKFFDGSTTQAISATFTTTTAGAPTDRVFTAQCTAIVRSTGATGTLQGVHPNQIGTVVGGARGLISLDLTNDLEVSVTTQCSVNSASNTMTFEQFYVSIEN